MISASVTKIAGGASYSPMMPTRPLSLTVPVRPSAQTVSHALFERLFADYQTPILNYLYRLLGEPALAEDLLQEAFTRAWNARRQLPTITNPRAWLYRIATNLARDHIRRARLLSWLPLLGHEPALADATLEEHALESERMRRALAKLSPEYRIPLVLYTCEGLAVAEVAALLALSPNAVKQRLVRARQKLRDAYR